MMGKMVKITLNKLRRDEAGQAFILALIMLLLGGLIMAPLLGFMGTGLKAGQAYEERMAELYAADAGIEDAIWKIMNNQVPDDPYYLTVNGKNVEVDMSGEDDGEITLLINLEVLPDNPSSYNKAKPHAEWLLVYVPIESSTPGIYDTYRITAFYNSTQKRELLGTGFWIHRYLGDNVTAIDWDFDEDGSLPPMDLDGNGFFDDEFDIDGDGITDIDEDNIIAKPLISPGFENDDYPYPVRTSEFLADVSRAFIWEWSPSQEGPKFAEPSDPVFLRTQRFALDPPIVLSDSKLPANVAWLDTKEECISISHTGEAVEINPIMATATDPATGKKTTVISHVFTESFSDGTVITTILTWESDIQ